MTKSTTATLTAIETKELSNLQLLIEDPDKLAALFDNETMQGMIRAKPHLAEVLDAALAEFTPEDDSLARALEDAAKRPAKRKTSTAAAAAAKVEPEKTFTYRVSSFKSKSAGNVVQGKEKHPAVHTIGIEEIDDETGKVWNRLMLGSHQASMMAAIARDKSQLAKLTKRAS